MKQMLLVSAGIHLLFIFSLFMIHLFKWNYPLVKPKILSVQWVTLPQVQPEARKPSPPEPVKAAEAPVRPKPLKKQILPAPRRIASVPKSKTVIPLPVPAKRKETAPAEQPAQTRKPETPSPPLEPKKEEPPPVEPQKIEIAPISEIDPTYVERIKRTVEMKWSPPEFSGQAKEVTVSFEVLRNGIVKSQRVVKSSKDPYFDMAALRAVVEARRFGQLPPDYPSLSIEITCTFSQNKGS